MKRTRSNPNQPAPKVPAGVPQTTGLRKLDDAELARVVGGVRSGWGDGNSCNAAEDSWEAPIV